MLRIHPHDIHFVPRLHVHDPHVAVHRLAMIATPDASRSPRTWVRAIRSTLSGREAAETRG